jgi:hypothetical protein
MITLRQTISDHINQMITLTKETLLFNMKDMLNSEKMNIMFLVETDTKLPNGKSDYKIEGYATVLQKTNQSTDKIRIIGLVEEDTF